jgi:hypothetical protein
MGTRERIALFVSELDLFVPRFRTTTISQNEIILKIY